MKCNVLPANILPLAHINLLCNFQINTHIASLIQNKGASAGRKENMLNNKWQAGAAKRAGPSSLLQSEMSPMEPS
jgi:hypothetical protein